MSADVAHVESHADGHADAHADHGHHATATGVSNEKLGMWVFLGSECLLFGALIATYLNYRGKSINGPYPDEVYNIPFTSASSFILLMSSLTMVLALSAIGRGDGRRGRIWLITTALLGSIFIGGQIYEFRDFYQVKGLGLGTNLFSSSFYVLTGFHGVHVTLGILMLFSLAFLSWRGKITKANAETVEIVGLYWHFVDVIWIVIFTVVYLIK
jgi:heme/copper-type cytochrome/quinol oxidase subunit 3